MFNEDSFNKLKPEIKKVLSGGTPGIDFVVLDIDDTVLRSNNGTVNPRDEGMFVLQHANFNNLDVHYVTARPETFYNREYTLDDLMMIGITPPDELIMRPPHINNWLDISKFKTNARKQLELATGGTCLMTVGDQWSDIMTIAPREREQLSLLTGNRYTMFQMLNDTWGVKLKE